MFSWLNKPTIIIAALLGIAYSIYIVATAAVTTPDGMATNIDVPAFIVPIVIILVISSVLGTIIQNRLNSDNAS